jgi:phosphopantothenoylcysteine decarboxylase/phosphopantothenate--cysteine ligase
VELEENPDILAGVAEAAPEAVRVGFAAETERLEEEALAKLEAKRVDLLVANDVSRPDIGFDREENEVTVFSRAAPPVFLSRRPKERLAADLLDLFMAALEREGWKGRGIPGATRPAVTPR